MGSLKEQYPPGAFVIVDQFIDRTFAREQILLRAPAWWPTSPWPHPVCPRLGDALEAAAGDLDISARCAAAPIWSWKGPQFSTRAESELYRSWGCDVIGMTNMPEAKLAREAELCYATVAMVTDYDCWHEDHDHVTVDQVIRVLFENADKARALIKQAAPMLRGRSGACPAGCHHALDSAVITQPEARDPALAARLDAVAGRVLGG